MKEDNQITKKQIYFWNMAGSLTYSFSSMILLMLVARCTSAKDADTFSIAYAIGQLLATIGLFQVRNYQATDVLEKYKFKDYFMFRILTNVFMVLSIVVYCAVKDYHGEKLVVVWLVCIYKGIETFSDVVQGLFQQKERLDLAGKSIVFRITISCAAFVLSLLILKNLAISCLVWIIAEIVCIVFYDLKNAKAFSDFKITRADWKERANNFKGLFWTCLPLFINGFLIMSIYNMPKNAIDTAITGGVLPAGSQRDYNILFMPSSVMNLFMIFLRPILTTMAIYWGSNKIGKFLKSVCIMTGGVAGFMIPVLIGGYLLGIPILGIIFGTSLEGYRRELMLLLLAGGLSSLATVFDNVITVIRKQKWLTISYMISILFSAFSSNILVEDYGLTGAAISFIGAIGILFLGNFVILLIGLGEKKRNG